MFILSSQPSLDWIKVVPIIISSLSLLLSISHIIFDLYKNRTDFVIFLEHYESVLVNSCHRCVFTFVVQNLSSAPLSILRMKIHKTKCDISHQWISEIYHPKFPETDTPCTERIFSDDFPIFIPPHGGKICRVIFRFPKRYPHYGESITIHITTEKKSKSFTLQIPIGETATSQ